MIAGVITLEKDIFEMKSAPDHEKNPKMSMLQHIKKLMQKKGSLKDGAPLREMRENAKKQPIRQRKIPENIIPVFVSIR